MRLRCNFSTHQVVGIFVRQQERVTTNAEYRALMTMREALSDQLVSAAGRRSHLVARTSPLLMTGATSNPFAIAFSRFWKRAGPAVGVGAADPLRASLKAAVSSERG